MSLLSNKNIVIIGGTSGMGLSATKAFLQAGARVVVVGKEDDLLEQARELSGPNAVITGGDATREGVASAAIDRCIESFGDLHGLYHVAGGSGRKMGDGPLHELTPAGWHSTLELNLTSLMLSNQAAVKKFLQTGRGGSILNMGSVLGFSPSPHFFTTHAYAAAKSAIIGFSKSVAACYAKNKIRVNVIAPALVQTPMAQRAANDEKIMSFVQTKQPLDGGRIGQPGDLDGLAVYFMSDQSCFTTGQVVAVDGGWSLNDGQF